MMSSLSSIARPVAGLTAAISLAFSVTAHAEPSRISAEKIDATVARVMASYDVPGMAVAIVEGDAVAYAQSYGVQEFGEQAKASPKTLFKIASVTKNFTTAALALLVDQGKIAWDDPVIDYIPEFRVQDPWITRNFTVRDLLIHKSGLNLGAGDLMFWPTPNDFTRADILHGLQFLPMTRGFRTQYAYDNILYVLAGELTERVTGQRWESFVEANLMRPLGMEYCFAGPVPEQYKKYIAQPHGMIDGTPTVVRRDAADDYLTSAPAGGIRCSIQAMTKWMKMHIARGSYTDANGQPQQLISAQQHAEMWSPQTIMNVGSRAADWDNTHFAAYGLGWRMHDVDGLLRVHHTGTLHGMNAYLSFFPELDVGFMVLMNRAHSDARTAVMQTMIKAYTDSPERDWVAAVQQWRKQVSAQRSASYEEPKTQPVTDELAAQVVGDYQDPWFGKVSVRWQDGELRWRSHRSQRMVGELLHIKGTTFAARWDDRTHHADAYVRFTTTMQGDILGMQLAPIDPAADFSFDFEDLNFTKQ
ncbi:Beta-lactamase [Pseudidiomarina piscicola]|uniref:Beta-lactamase n=1 Tax=Pseudidiomarina piscicola TaxID=2614830 RepID=A0A6S6WMN8_9GAMM|nr:serine hydrolase [Pseudidiomarina piscicola]CAB0150709.1 Beta-lactamase [Pseudidiomarina piscicola]VZT40216.1 Beta-lactamase [Pseudomonas aeruginosa]